MKILFISHSASRTGAPMLLLHLLRWLREHTDHECDVVLLRGGALEAEFARVAKVVPAKSLSRIYDLAALRARTAGLDPRLGFLRRAEKLIAAAQHGMRLAARGHARRGRGYDLIYCNTAANGAVLEALAPLRCPVLTHIHELEYAIGLMQPAFGHVLRLSDAYIAVSRAVEANLVGQYGVAPEKIHVAYGFVDTAHRVDKAGAREQVLRELGLPPEALLVGGCGSLEWRKGPDLWLQAARTALVANPELPLHFVWIGGAAGPYRDDLLYDVRRLGLAAVHFVSETTDPATWLAALDVFALTSREDPFPLVCLEAAAQGVPSVCFADAGGMPEFIEEDCGFVVPYADVAEMADRLVQLSRDEPLRQTMGEAAYRKVCERHSLSVGAARVAGIMAQVAAQR